MPNKKREVFREVHKASGVFVLVIMISIISSSLYGEIINEQNIIRSLKTYNFYIIFVKLTFIIVCAITGKKMTGNSKLQRIKSKNNRLKYIILNELNLLILAFLLYQRAIDEKIDQLFFVIQIIEFMFGLINIYMLSLMINDGKVLSNFYAVHKDKKLRDFIEDR